MARGLVARGIAVEVACCDPGASGPSVEVDDGVVVRRFPTIRGDRTFFLSPTLARWILDEAGRFDLVHAQSYHTPLALAGLVAARRARRPFALTAHYHGAGHTRFRNALHLPYRIPGRFLVRHARPLICVSAAEHALLQRHFGEDLDAYVIPNGVAVDEIQQAQAFQVADGQALVVTAGRLERYKQVDRLIDAMVVLPARYRLVVIGDGPERDNLRQRATTLGLDRRVDFPGHVSTSTLYRWLRTANVFVSMSLHEAFGMTVLEAAAAGAGVVASAIPAHRELAAFIPAAWVEYVSVAAPTAELASAVQRAERRPLDREAVSTVPTWSDVVDSTIAAYEAAPRVRRPARRCSA